MKTFNRRVSIIIFLNIVFALLCNFAYTDGEETVQLNQTKKKKTGFDWMGVPFLKFRSDFGLGGGAKVSLFDYGKEKDIPFKYNLQLQYFATSLGKKDHVLFFMAPNFMRSRIDFDIELRYQYLDNSKYFGIGNETENVSDYVDEDASIYKNKRYYEYKRSKPRFVLNVLKQFNKEIRLLMGLGLQKTTIRQHSEEGALQETLLYKELPYGLAGGYTNFLKLGVVYDSRNTIASPNKGIWSEIAIEFAGSYLGSDYKYNRYTLTDRRYYQIFSKGVLAQQIIFEWMSGQAPFYEYSFIGGSATLMEGLGGNKSLRGYFQNRFIDKTKLITNTEMRYLWKTIKHRQEKFDFYNVAFWDMGRVFSKVANFSLNHIRYTYGGGLRIAWNHYFVGRFDLGISPEGYNVNIGFANTF